MTAKRRLPASQRRLGNCCSIAAVASARPGCYTGAMTKSPVRRGARKPARRPKRAKMGRIFTGDQALHELFREQAAAVLDDADIGEEEKQSILLAMSCPCCGAGGPSFSFKLKRRT